MNSRQTSHQTLSLAGTEVVSRASTEELLLELRRRIVRPRDRRRETWDDWDGLSSRVGWDGLASRGEWPDEG